MGDLAGQDGQQAREARAGLPACGQVTVIGGGPTGIETAADVAAARPELRVRMIASSVAGDLSARAYRRLRTGPARLTVEIVDDVVTKSPRVQANRLWPLLPEPFPSRCVCAVCQSDVGVFPQAQVPLRGS